MPRVIKGPDGKVHSFPDEATDQQISVALRAIPSVNAPPTSKAPTWMPAAGRGTQFRSPDTQTIENALPGVGGAIGGMVGMAGGPLTAIGTAALGGAAGEAAKQQLRNIRTNTPGIDITAMAEQGALQGGSEAAGAALGVGMKTAAPWLMSKVVRPSYQLLQDYKTTAPKLAQTLLDNGINVTEGGLSKLQGLIRSTNQQIRDLVENSAENVSKDEVLRRVDDLSRQTMKTTPNPAKAMAKASDVADAFVEHPYYKGDSIPVTAAHDLKVGTYKQIGDSYRKPEKAQALKALARGLKEEVAAKVPVVAEKNAEEAALMAAGEAVSKRVAADANADPFGILWASHNPSMFIAGLIHKQPVLRSMLANGLWKSASAASKVSPQVLRSAMFAIASGQPEDEK